MIDIFNSEFATTSVNIIVILALLLFIYFVLRKFLPSIAGENLKDKIKTSTTSQNIFAFVSVIVASTFLDLFSDGNYHMLWSVLVISILTILFSFLYEKVSNKNNEIEIKEEYKRGLNLVSNIIDCKGYGLIKDAKSIERVEDRSEEIYVFTENLITDIPKEYISEEYDNIGLLANIVADNIPKGKRYIYFLKDTIQNKEYFKLYSQYHFKDEKIKYKENVSFYFIKEEDFCFFSELYLYKNKNIKDRSFEWIPSIGEKGDPNKQFYLELNSEQTQNINEIICELMVSNKKVVFQGVLNEI